MFTHDPASNRETQAAPRGTTHTLSWKDMSVGLIDTVEALEEPQGTDSRKIILTNCGNLYTLSVSVLKLEGFFRNLMANLYTGF